MPSLHGGNTACSVTWTVWFRKKVTNTSVCVCISLSALRVIYKQRMVKVKAALIHIFLLSIERNGYV